ncbi:MAG: hypothetical protein M0011_00165 [Elusimicrobia bacterium]|nr:hypothetical protein [Elusimicrobiota bacterium]
MLKIMPAPGRRALAAALLAVLSATVQAAAAVLCFNDRPFYQIDRFAPDLPSYVDRDFRHLAPLSGYIREMDNYSIRLCPGAIALDSLQPRDREDLARNNDRLWEDEYKYNIHNNVLSQDMGLYHQLYFPYELFTPAAAFPSAAETAGPAEADMLNSTAAALWGILDNVCNDGDGQKARVKYLFGRRMCGDQSGELRSRMRDLRKAARALARRNGELRLAGKAHPLFVQLLLEELAGAYVWGGPMTAVNANFPEARKETILRVSRFLADTPLTCAQLGLWPLHARALLAATQHRATIIPGVNGVSDYNSPAGRLAYKAAAICGEYGSGASSFYDLETTAPRDLYLLDAGYEEKP